MGDIMRQIKVGKDGVVPILDTSKLYVMEVYFQDRYNGNFLLEPLYYACVQEKEGVTWFVRNSIIKDVGCRSDSIQGSVKKALVESHPRWTALVYEFDNAQEFEKERNVTLYVDVKK